MPEHIYVHVYTEQQVTQDVFLSYSLPFLRQNFPLNIKLINLARIVGLLGSPRFLAVSTSPMLRLQTNTFHG